MFGQLGRRLGRLLADFLGLFVEVFVVVHSRFHAINLVSALAVKSTMGTTRA